MWLSIASSPAGEQGHVTGPQAKELTAEPQRRADRSAARSPQRRRARLSGNDDAADVRHLPDGVLLRRDNDLIRSTRVEDVARAEPYFRDAFLAITEGRQVTRASTPPYGCAIKHVDA